MTGDLLKAELRDSTMYCSKEVDRFMQSLLNEFLTDYPDMPLYLRGDNGFALLDLYEVLETNDCKYVIWLKENVKFWGLAGEEDQILYRATKFNQVNYATEYGEFMYQTGSWRHPRRVVFKLRNHLSVHCLAYNLFNWFKWLALSADMRKQHIDTIRLKLLKIVARVVRSVGYKYVKLCSN